jgi:hypothetical protein
VPLFLVDFLVEGAHRCRPWPVGTQPPWSVAVSAVAVVASVITSSAAAAAAAGMTVAVAVAAVIIVFTTDIARHTSMHFGPPCPHLDRLHEQPVAAVTSDRPCSGRYHYSASGTNTLAHARPNFADSRNEVSHVLQFALLHPHGILQLLHVFRMIQDPCPVLLYR